MKYASPAVTSLGITSKSFKNVKKYFSDSSLYFVFLIFLLSSCAKYTL